MIKINYNIFITKFPEFQNLTPQEVENAEAQIGAYISPIENTAVLNNSLREQACYLATAVICKESLNLQNNTFQPAAALVNKPLIGFLHTCSCF